MGAAGAEAAPPAGRDAKAQTVARRRWRATESGAPPRRGPEVLGGDLESKTACRPANGIFGLGIRIKKGPGTGRAHPACRVAEHAIKATPEWQRAAVTTPNSMRPIRTGRGPGRFQPETPAAALNFSQLAAASEWGRIRSNPPPSIAGMMTRAQNKSQTTSG